MRMQLDLTTPLANFREEYTFATKPTTAVVCIPGRHGAKLVSIAASVPGAAAALPVNAVESQNKRPGVDADCFSVDMARRCVVVRADYC
jgi:hypothetical protein